MIDQLIPCSVVEADCIEDRDPIHLLVVVAIVVMKHLLMGPHLLKHHIVKNVKDLRNSSQDVHACKAKGVQS